MMADNKAVDDDTTNGAQALLLIKSG